MVGYSEKGWLKWKMRRGKWPDLGLNPFPFHFSFINNPPTTQSTPNHTLSTPPPPLLLPHPLLATSHFPLTPKVQLQEPVGKRHQGGASLHLKSSSPVKVNSEKGRERDRGMVDGKVAMKMSLSVASFLAGGSLNPSLSSSLSKYSLC